MPLLHITGRCVLGSTFFLVALIWAVHFESIVSILCPSKTKQMWRTGGGVSFINGLSLPRQTIRCAKKLKTSMDIADPSCTFLPQKVAIGICSSASESMREKIQNLHINYGFPVLTMEGIKDQGYAYSLQFNNEGALGIHCHTAKFSPLYVDFTSGKLGYRGCRPEVEQIYKAVQLKDIRTPVVWDMTAGLGRDSFILACAGCRVHMLERSPVIGNILLDGLERLGKDEDQQSKEIRSLLSLSIGDSTKMQMASVINTVPEPQVVYLDPMFPAKSKKALAKKDMQILQGLLGHGIDQAEKEEEEENLFNVALRLCSRRVVVKRPAKGPPLAGRPPSFVLPGKTNRFDVYSKA